MRQVIAFAKRRYWASIIVGTVAPGAIAALVMYIVTDGVTGWWPIAAAVLGGLLTAGALSLIGGNEPTNQPGIAQPLPLTNQPGIAQPSLPTSFVQGKVFSPRTPDELVNEVKGLTDIRRQHTIQLHLGQWLHVTGHIRDVRQTFSDGEIAVSVGLVKSDVRVLLYFAPSYWQTRLQAANIGDTISAIGKIKDIEPFGGSGLIWLDECDMLDLSGNPLAS